MGQLTIITNYRENEVTLLSVNNVLSFIEDEVGIQFEQDYKRELVASLQSELVDQPVPTAIRLATDTPSAWIAMPIPEAVHLDALKEAIELFVHDDNEPRVAVFNPKVANRLAIRMKGEQFSLDKSTYEEASRLFKLVGSFTAEATKDGDNGDAVYVGIDSTNPHIRVLFARTLPATPAG